MQQPNTLTIIKLQNLEISENLLLWGMRFCLNSSKLDKLPLKKLLEMYLPKSKLLFAFKECVNIANSLERESYFLPLRHNENINFNYTQHNSKRILH